MFADVFELIWTKGRKIIRFLCSSQQSLKPHVLKDNLASQKDSLYNEKKESASAFTRKP
jgi:hypothetical protein